MMKDDSPKAITVRLLDKEYLVGAPEPEQEALRQAAVYLDRKMREIRASGKTMGLDRIAVMAALNIAHELLQNGGPAGCAQAPAENTLDQALEARLDALGDRIDAALERVSRAEI